VIKGPLALVVVATSLIAPSGPAENENQPYEHFVGALHNHSGYSDGWPGTTPTKYFDLGRAEGLDFMGSGEHSDNADVPITFSEGCLGAAAPMCVGATPEHFDKWDATQERADAATKDGFVAFRGFEWTSDRFGHINVYFSKHDTNAKIDGGYAVMDTFWKWFTTSPGLGGGADGLATFNHPGAKSLDDSDPALNWNDFGFVPEADHRMVGIEVYNDDDQYGSFYTRALDKGWHLGAVGAEDLHGIPKSRDDYGSERWAKTVVLARENSVEAIREAMLARRFYAIRYNDTDAHRLKLDFTVDDEPMGSRLVRSPGDVLRIDAKTNHPRAEVELVTSGGRVVAGQQGNHWDVVWQPTDRYYFMRVKEDGVYTGYGSPVWVSPVAQTQGEWLAGDLHVHTCYSHDAYCGPSDDNTGPEEFYTLSGDVSERFTEAALRGLDYLAITDHNDVRSVDHAGFGSLGVVGIPGYENSLNGHAQMLGADRIYEKGDSGSVAINTMAKELRADGGVFQINHPAEDLLTPLDEGCTDTSGLDWAYGFDVVPDTLEVWNIGHFWQPPMPSGSSNQDAITYWECWLDRGARVGATGGSDSHWLSISAAQGPGNPTTWVFAADRTKQAILDAIGDGRTSISLLPPVLGELRLHLEADANGDGTFESIVGDEVPPGSKMRVRADGLPGAGLVEVRANGDTIVKDASLAPGGYVAFDAPDDGGWVRATLRGPDLRDERAAACDPLVGDQTTYCRNHIAVLALTSPIYLTAP
jgi:hypothetical protein